MPYSKYCIVPKCKNTTVSAPNKLFFYVPRDAKIRKKWCSIMRRDDTLSHRSSLYCCEDHFDLETDMENYLKYKLIGGVLKLKKGVTPHKFACQKTEERNPVEWPGYKKRQQIEYFERVPNSNICHENLTPQVQTKNREKEGFGKRHKSNLKETSLMIKQIESRDASSRCLETDLQNVIDIKDEPLPVEALPVLKDLTMTCRVCLADDVVVHSMRDTGLQGIFENLTSTKVNTDDVKPASICYVCRSQLKKCVRFLEMSQASERLLADLASGIEIKHCEFVKIEKMKPNLLVAPLSYVTIKELHLTNKSSVKEEIHENEIVRANNDDTLSVSDDGTSEMSHTSTQQYDSEIDSSVAYVKEDILENENSLKEIETVEMSNTFIHDIIDDKICCSSINNTSEVLMKEEIHEDGDPLKEIETCTMSNTLIQDGIKERGEICDVCNKTIVSSNYNAHMDAHGGFICDLCDQTIFTKKLLIRHMKDHDARTTRTCKQCNITISSIANFRRHMRIHSTHTLYACNECNKMFHRRDHLQIHMSSHTGDNSKSYGCKLCKRKFKRKGHLTDHMKTHSQTKPFACKECDKTFLRNFNLQNHIKTHKEIKIFLCKHCGKLFSRSNHLKTHLNVHTGYKPYSCKLCDKRFFRSDHVTSHMKVHTKSKSTEPTLPQEAEITP